MQNEDLKRRRFYLSKEVMDYVDEQAALGNMSPSLFIEEVLKATMQLSPYRTLDEVTVEK